MKKVNDYLRHAADCRDLARTASSAHQQQLAQMAQTWEQLAGSRKRQMETRGATDEQGLVIEFEMPSDDDNHSKRKH